MQPLLRPIRSSRKDRLSINILPDQSVDTDANLPCLPCLFGEPVECCYSSRLVDEDPSEGYQPDAGETKVEAAIMSEVADWWQSRYVDEFWTPRNKQQRLLPPTASQILLQIKNSKAPAAEPWVSADAFESLLHAIALQLLASCYTLLPASSCHLPAFQQRTRPTPISALRLHTRHLFEPAAGHHARVSSETAAWPGLCAQPGLEDHGTEAVTMQRRQIHHSDHVPCFAASGWADGPSSPEAHDGRMDLGSPAESTSSCEPGFFSRLICQPSIPRSPRRKHHTLFTGFATRRGKQPGTLPTRSRSTKSRRNRTKVLQALTEQTVQRIPSMLRLRQTQSAPRIEGNEPDIAAQTYHLRRHSSNPLIGSPLDYAYEIPEIHYTSATPAASLYGPRASHVVRLCGRGDLITQNEDEDFGTTQADTCIDSTQTSTRSTTDSYTNFLSLPTVDTPALSPLAISPRTTTAPQPLPPRLGQDYFASVHAATHVHDNKDFEIDDQDDLKGEREDAGPRLEESPYLQIIFAKMDALEETYMSDDDSSSEDMERDGRRRSILPEAGSTSEEVVEKFGMA